MSEKKLRIVEEHVPPESGANTSIVVVACGLAVLGGLLFAGGILFDAPLYLYGTGLALGCLALGVAVRRFFTDNFSDVEAVEERALPAMDEVVPLSDVSSTGRRPFLRRVIIGAAGIFGLSTLAAVPSLGPRVGDAFERTRWANGVRLVDGRGNPIAADGIAGGGVETVWPEGAIGHERSAVVVVRLFGENRAEEPTNLDWVVDERIIAYSKICSHAGCPVGLYREVDNALFCPCHQSTFDARRGAEPTFGPTARSLPQLPIGKDEDGNLVATGDFTELVGPAIG